jgi:hypothetical protein
MSGWEWFVVIAGGASVASLPMALILGWMTKRFTAQLHVASQQTMGDMQKTTQQILGDMHQATQTTLGDLGRAFADSQRRLSDALERMSSGQAAMLERMDRAAEQRHQTLLALLARREGGTDAP